MEEAHREVLWNVGLAGYLVYPVMSLAMIAFLVGMHRHYRLWRMGTGNSPRGNLWGRFGAVLTYAIGHRRTGSHKELYPAVMHICIFVGMLILFLATAILMVEDWSSRIISFSFLRGGVYLWYSVISDIGGLILFVGLGMAAYRRYRLRPERLTTIREDGIILALLALINFTGFTNEGLRMAVTELEQHPDWALWSPGGYLVAQFASSFGLPPEGLINLHRASWAIHMLMVAGMIAYTPFSKLSHIFVSTANVFYRSFEPKGALQPIRDIETAETFGVGKLQDFTWRQLLQMDACTNCGRCQDNCPAHLSGKPLSPRRLVQDLREHLLQSGPLWPFDSAQDRPIPVVASAPPVAALVGEVIADETLWACVTCGACMEACPVLIEHVPAIVDMRRHLVMTEGRVPEAVQNTLRTLERQGHPWRGSQHIRGDWMEGMEVPPFTSGEEVEYLYWVGCTGALDDRSRSITLATIKVLQAAGVSFGVLGAEESCTGDPARRLGNEYLFQMMAQQTITILNSHKAKKIVTHCPHCFNTIKNEYPQLGGNYEVIHHTQLVVELMKQGKLNMAKPVAAGETIAYHDSCYLGRHNGEYEAPRAIAHALSGAKVVEMARNREQSFCCGAGGGNAWMEMKKGTNINRMRTEQAKEVGATIIAVACPFCVIMFEDGIRQVDAVETMKTKDLVELVAESLP